MQTIIPTNATADMTNTIPAITIGLDLGDKNHAVCVLNAAGEIVEERSITNHRESLRRLSKKYPESRIALEVGTHSPWTSRFLKDLDTRLMAELKATGDPRASGGGDAFDGYPGPLPRKDPK